jgi:hypothetical protein
MDLGPLRQRTVWGGKAGNRRKEPLLQLGIAQGLGQGPAKTGVSRALQIVPDRGVREMQTPSDLSHAQAELKVKTKNFLDFTHR